MSIKLISKHRTELMAIALIWVALYHSYFPITNKAISFILVKCGYAGASLFLFLSGFSMFYSYKKDSDYTSFIKKRLLRILPFCLPLICLNVAINNEIFLDALTDAFGLNWLRGVNRTNWYTSVILILYFVTPFYLKMFMGKEKIVTVLTISVLVLISILIKNDVWAYCLTNMCLYIEGIYFAYLNDNDIAVNSVMLLALFILGWIAMFMMYHFYRNDIQHVCPLILIAPFMLISLGYIFDILHCVQRSLVFLGGCRISFTCFMNWL